MTEIESRKLVEKAVDDLRLLDDNLMKAVFQEDRELTEFVLRTVLQDDTLDIVTMQPQKVIYNLKHHSVQLDVFAVDDRGRQYDLEIQGADGDERRKRIDKKELLMRSRYYGDMVDVNHLNKGEAYQSLPQVYVVFITEVDFLGQGRPVYTVERFWQGEGAKNDAESASISEYLLPHQDGSHILYVNGEYDGDDAIGRLMNDFRARKLEDIMNPVIKERVRYFKEGKGRETMCRSFIEYGQICAEDARAETEKKMEKKIDEVCQEFDATLRLTIQNLLKDGKTKEQIVHEYPFPKAMVYEVAASF